MNDKAFLNNQNNSFEFTWIGYETDTSIEEHQGLPVFKVDYGDYKFSGFNVSEMEDGSLQIVLFENDNEYKMTGLPKIANNFNAILIKEINSWGEYFKSHLVHRK